MSNLLPRQSPQPNPVNPMNFNPRGNQQLFNWERRQDMEIEQQLDKGNPLITIQKEAVDQSVLNLLKNLKVVKLQKIIFWLDQQKNRSVDLNILKGNLDQLWKIAKDDKSSMDFEQLKTFLESLNEQYKTLNLEVNFRELEKIKEELKKESQGVEKFLQQKENIDEALRNFEQLKFLEQDLRVTSQLLNLLVNHQNQYQENIIIEMMNDEELVIDEKVKKSIENEQIDEEELRLFIDHLNQYYLFKSYPKEQSTGILLILNNQEPSDLEKFKYMDRVIVIQQFLLEQQSTNPEERWKKTYALLEMTKNQQATMFCLAKIKPLMQNICEKFECQPKATIVSQLAISDIITKFFSLVMKSFKPENTANVIKQIKYYMLMIKRQKDKVDCFELQQIGL